jgi:tRNA(Ile)-lysidine synthase
MVLSMREHYFFPHVGSDILCDDPSSLVDLRRSHVAREMRRWLPRSETVIMASSGGVDSLAMAVAARVVIDDPSRITMVHVDHGLRESSGRDARCTMLQAWALGFSFDCVQIWVPRFGNLYEQGRHSRYAALASAASRYGAGAIMTAHHADDLVETMIMRLSRGSPIKSAELIRRKVNVFGANVLRPMLSLPQQDLYKFALASGIPWVDDPSNKDVRRERALIRSTVGSALRNYRSEFSMMAARSLLADQ